MTSGPDFTSYPMICISCRVDRHELCSAPDHVYCECDCPKERAMPSTIRTPDIVAKTYDKEGREIDCAPTLQQHRQAAETMRAVHFVGFQSQQGGWDE